ncbi:hypothetical protein [Cognatitamlana onchidii]|uniref:hypothetical protein n=1 Tax=Cognatitamlana onchidii TaxID=2562860 RepID=UPI001455EA13|nr:hypothetical protein [Algibacter onchidii]
MAKLLKSISYIFHPIVMPLAGVIFYFSKSPRYIAPEVIKAKLISVLILTVLLPIVLYFLLKILGKVNSIYLKSTKERIIPLVLNCLVLFVVIRKILTPTQAIELYFFFLGILFSALSCLILVLLKVKASMHMIGVSGLFMFFIALSIHFSININKTLALTSIILGAVATSRLHMKAHSFAELILGLVLGALPQLILTPYWI